MQIVAIVVLGVLVLMQSALTLLMIKRTRENSAVRIPADEQPRTRK